MSQISDLRMVDFVMGATIAVITFLCVFPPDIFVFRQGTNFTVQIMFAFLFVGMALLLAGKQRLMFIALGASGILALNLKSHSDQELKFPSVNENPNLSVAHVDLSMSEDSETTLYAIRSHDVDVISFQEYTPYWDKILPTELLAQYPYRSLNSRLDPYGKAIFSKFPLCTKDTITLSGFSEIPGMHVEIILERGAQAHIVSAHSIPPINDGAYTDIREYFVKLSSYMNELSGPIITLGDFSLPPWSEEIKTFKDLAHLVDSRRDLAQHLQGDKMFLFSIPIDHIFYSGEIECTSFSVINYKGESPLGITGNYQLKTFASLSELK